MDDREAEGQIDQMVAFILNEAKDKAEEIEAKALEDFNIEKLKLVTQQKEKIRSETAKKAKQLESRVAIERSTRVNEARVNQQIARAAALDRVADSAKVQIQRTTQDRVQYVRLLQNLIVQGLLKLYKETAVQIRCREQDVSMVEEALNQASKAFTQFIERETTKNVSVALTIDSSNYLSTECLGGVQLAAEEGKIIVDNTFDARLRITIEKDKPYLRKRLFA